MVMVEEMVFGIAMIVMMVDEDDRGVWGCVFLLLPGAVAARRVS